MPGHKRQIDELPDVTRVEGEQHESNGMEYRILSQVGGEHAGLLYRAVRVDDGSNVDVCVLNDLEASEQQQLRRRLALVQQLEHPAVARVINLDEQDDQVSCLLEPITGRRLSELANLPVADPAQVLQYAHQLSSAVASAHRLGLVHGNLSPDSICLREDGSLQVDFVRAGNDDETLETLQSDGSFTAPEIETGGQHDAASDLYALGRLLGWMIGANPGQESSVQDAIRTELSKVLANAGNVQESDVDAIAVAIEEACSKEPSDRGSAADICDALQRILGKITLADIVKDPFSATTAHSPDSRSCEEDKDQLETLLVDSPHKPPKPMGAPADSKPSNERPKIGRFQLVSKLGEGGMGAVFKAIDTADGSTVALKVLSRKVLGQRTALRRFQKEARMLGEIRSPFVTNLIEVNHDGRVHFIVMEFVSGRDLKAILRKQSQLDEQTALSVAADIARGLATAHEQGIIHRDVKPANILLASKEEEADFEVDETRRNVVDAQSLSTFNVKLSDFGLARHLDQSESMQLTQEGGFIGTPTYMPPEQFDGKELSPASDIYSLGATLYEMLAGRPPFRGTDINDLINQHCNVHPAPLSKHGSLVSDAAEQIVRRALAKDPGERYADAAQFLRDVERLMRGEPTNIEAHPAIPKEPVGKIFEEVFEWDLESKPSDLWPYVSNTDRINQAVGVPSVEYENKRDEHGRLRKYGTFRMAGLTIGWEEHPFEWIEGQRLGILREFHQGPFAWFLSIVELLPGKERGTHLKHTVRILPRGMVGRAVATMEVTLKGKRNLDRVYRRIDQAVMGRLGKSPTLDPFTESVSLPSSRQMQLETGLDELSQRGVDPAVMECLSQFLREAPSQELGRIRPLALARSFNLPPEAMTDGCLHAAAAGLLELHWDILCPTCRISSKVADTLQQVEDHANCEVCDLDFDVDLSKSVELVFRASPGIREADIGTYCIGGPEHSPHVVMQIRLQPASRVELTPTLSEGEYVLRSAQLPSSYRIQALPGKGTSHAEIVLSDRLGIPPVLNVRAGRVVMTVTNDHDREVVLRVERRVPMQDVVTAARACSMPRFRELFPAESPSSGTLLKVSTVTLLAIDLVNPDQLFDTSSDAEAYAHVKWLQDLIIEAASKHAGRLVQSFGTESLLVFETPLAVVDFAADVISSVANDDRGLEMKSAAHRGSALATSSETMMAYFGQNVHAVRRLLQHAGGGELLLTEPVSADPLAADVISRRGLESSFEDVAAIGRLGLRCRRVRVR